ncbi:uncharacterized protein LOC144706850 [Wolffia australiana]
MAAKTRKKREIEAKAKAKAKGKGKLADVSSSCSATSSSLGARPKGCIFVDDASVAVDVMEDVLVDDDARGASEYYKVFVKNPAEGSQSNLPVSVKDEELSGSELEEFGVKHSCRGSAGILNGEDSNVLRIKSNSDSKAGVPDFSCAHSTIKIGMWVRMKYGHYKGDLAMVVAINASRKQATVMLVPRIDLHSMAKKLFGGETGSPVKRAVVATPRLIKSRDLEIFRPRMKTIQDNETGKVFDILDGVMLKDGYLYKKVSFFSLIFAGVKPSKAELLKFEPSPKEEPQDTEWMNGLYEGHCSKNSTDTLGNRNVFQAYDLVSFGEKDFGIIISMDSDILHVLKGDTEGSTLISIQRKDVKKSLNGKIFTASDCNMKTISIDDNVKVVEGLQMGREGTVRHIFRDALFLYDKENPENNGYFSTRSDHCEVTREDWRRNVAGTQGILGRKEDSDKRTRQADYFAPYADKKHRQSSEDLPFKVGQNLRIRTGPKKGYICRVVRTCRSAAVVRLESSGKLMKFDIKDLKKTIPSLFGFARDDDSAEYDNPGNQGMFPEGELVSEVEGVPRKASWETGSQSNAWNSGKSWSDLCRSPVEGKGALNDQWAETGNKEANTAAEGWGSWTKKSPGELTCPEKHRAADTWSKFDENPESDGSGGAWTDRRKSTPKSNWGQTGENNEESQPPHSSWVSQKLGNDDQTAGWGSSWACTDRGKSTPKSNWGQTGENNEESQPPHSSWVSQDLGNDDQTAGWGSGGAWTDRSRSTPKSNWGQTGENNEESQPPHGSWVSRNLGNDDQTARGKGKDQESQRSRSGWAAENHGKDEQTTGWGGNGKDKESQCSRSGWAAENHVKDEQTTGWGGNGKDKESQCSRSGWAAENHVKDEQTTGWGGNSKDKESPPSQSEQTMGWGGDDGGGGGWAIEANPGSTSGGPQLEKSTEHKSQPSEGGWATQRLGSSSPDEGWGGG